MATRHLTNEITKARSKLASWQFAQLSVFFVLLLLVVPLIQHDLIVKSISTLFVLNSLLVADSSSPNARVMRGTGWLHWGIGAAASIAEELHLSVPLTFGTKYIAITAHMLLYVLCAGSILSVVFRAGRITLDGILASVVAYQLIGLFFAQVYTLAIVVDPSSLHLPDDIQPSSATFQVEMIYFSFVTLATLGYGDILPNSNLTRSVAILEAIIGQFYVAVIVAVLVSAFVSQRMQNQSGSSNGST